MRATPNFTGDPRSSFEEDNRSEPNQGFGSSNDATVASSVGKKYTPSRKDQHLGSFTDRHPGR